MRTRLIPAGVMLTAGAIVSIISIVQDKDVLQSLKTLLAVLIIFYIVGLIARSLVERILTNFKKEEPQEEENMEENLDENPDEETKKE